MKLTPVDKTNLLWAVSDIWPEELIDDVLSINWLNQPFERDDADAIWPRRNLLSTNSVTTKVNEYMTQCIPRINQITGNNFTVCHGSSWWINDPGFISPIHHDGSVSNNMLIYWYAPDKLYGTTFYNSDNANDVLHRFESIAGTGYFMITPESGPLQWHGMLNPVPPGQFRLASFWWFS